MSKNRKLLSLIAATLFGAASLSLVSTGAMAASSSAMPLTSPKTNHQIMKISPVKCRGKMIKVIRIILLEGKHKPAFRLGLARNKHLSPENARTIIKAALLLKNRHDLNVGKIENLQSPHGKKLYVIRIVNPKNEIVSKVIMNSASGKYRPMRIS